LFFRFGRYPEEKSGLGFTLPAYRSQVLRMTKKAAVSIPNAKLIGLNKLMSN
jgi:hypothetical protein